jgi:hypothetical protein
MKWTFELISNDPGERSLANPGRSPEDKGRNIAGFNGPAQDGVFTYEVSLTDIFIQIFRPHSFGKWSHILLGTISINRDDSRYFPFPNDHSSFLLPNFLS